LVVEVLDISFCFRLGGIETARALAAAPNITKIAMRYIGLTDECVREISKVLPNLTSVNFGYTDVTDASIRHLAQCNKLTQLILWKCSKIKFSAIRCEAKRVISVTV
jgi:ABC-type lipopolysaccharide export system ATPase subunit